MESQISWTFFVENLPQRKGDRGEALLRLLESELPDSKKVAAQLFENSWSIALALSTVDLTDPMARAIEYLNLLNVPVTAWVVLSEEQGYWASVGNVVHAADTADAIRRWADKKGVLFRRFGFDFEIPIQVMRAFFSKDRRALAREFLGYLRALRKREWANRYLRDYIEILHTAGVGTEFYVFPGIFQFLLGGGLVTRKKWRRIVMLYSSGFPGKLGELMLRRRDPSAIPALGIVSGSNEETPGVNLGGGLPRHLTATELARDISLACKVSEEAYLFALNSPLVCALLANALREIP